LQVRIRINDPDFKQLGVSVLEAFHGLVTSSSDGSWSLVEENHEGWRVNVDEGGGKYGWLLLRQSLHDPILVLNVESEISGGCKAGATKVLSFLKQRCANMPLDLEKLEALANK